MKRITHLTFLFIVTTLAYRCTNAPASGTGNDNIAPENSLHGSSEKQSPKKYVHWVEDKSNGLHVEKSIGDYTYELQYKPLEYVALQDIKKEHISKDELTKVMNEYSDLQYFNFRISTQGAGELLKKDLENENDYYARIQYYSFEMQKDLKLIEGKDTLDCVLFHFERVYGVAPYATFVMGFPATNNKLDKTLEYNEKVIGAGKIYLTVKANNYKQLPSVITGSL